MERLSIDPNAGQVKPLEYALSVLERVHALEANPHALAMVGFGVRAMHTQTPLFWLPTEILSKILHLHLISNRGRWYYHRLQDLTSVCFGWYILIRRTPALWCFVCDRMSEHWLKKSLCHYSLNVPLHIRGSTWSQPGAYPDVYQKFLDHIKPHSLRWRWLELEISDLYPTANLVGCHAPSLRGIRIDRRGEGTARLSNNFAGDNSNLRRVILNRVAMRWSFNDLRVLNLGQIHSHGPSLGQLAAAIASSPLLYRLKLFGVTISPESDPNHAAVVLSSLKHLSLLDIGVSNMTFIANLVTGCVCDTLELVEERDETPTYSSLFSACPSYISDSILNMANNGTSVRIQLQQEAMIIVLERKWIESTSEDNFPSGSIWPAPSNVVGYYSEISLPVASHLDCLSYIGQLQFHQARVDLTIQCPLTSEELDQLMRIQAIERLRLCPSIGGSASEILELLSCPKSGLDGTSDWPLPHLRKLEFVGETFTTAQQVADMVETRYGHVGLKDVEFAGGDNGDGSTRDKQVVLCALTTLDITDMRGVTPDILKRLRMYFGDEAVKWIVP